MSNLPGFSNKDTARPPSRAEIKERERELNGLVEWYRTNGNYAAVKKVTRARSNVEVDALVNRGYRRYVEERIENLDAIRSWQHLDLKRIRDGHIEAAASGDVPSSHVVMKVQEREAKLAGSDARPDVQVNMGTVVITGNVGPEQMAAIPEGVEVVDARKPWEREDVIEGEEAE